MGMQFMLVDDNGNVIRKTPFVFSFISRSYDGFNVEIIEPVIFHKDTTTLDLVFLHLDSNFNLKFIYPANCIARSPYGAKGISYILNHGFWGAVDSLGHYIYEPEYDEIVNIDHNSDELDALKIKYGKNNEDNIRMRVFRSEYEKNSYEHYDLYMPADCLPYVIHPGNLGQFFDEADELTALEYLQGKYGTSQKFNELYQFHHGIFCAITHNMDKSINLFTTLSNSSNRNIRSLSRKNLRSIERHSKRTKIAFKKYDTNTVEPNRQRAKGLKMDMVISHITDNGEFARRYRENVYDIQVGKRIVLYDKNGKVLKCTLPIYDDVQFNKNEIICTRNITYSDKYTIQLLMTLDKDLNVKENSARAIRSTDN